uniref:Uncharacterized protein n=1 Tax=viral metagenome TaxID=1070528 RepID=A0A6C0CA07_9ZZZZ
MFAIEKLIYFEAKINTDIARCKEALFESSSIPDDAIRLQKMTNLIDYYERMQTIMDEDDLSCYLDPADYSDGEPYENHFEDPAIPMKCLAIDELLALDDHQILESEFVFDENVPENIYDDPI